jgi:hypothetical protein
MLALHVEIARTASALGLADEALAQREKVLALLLTREPAGAPAVLSAQLSLADMLSELGQYQRAAALHREALASASRAHGGDSDAALQSLVAQASFLYDHGQSGETLATLQRIVDTHRKRGSGDHEQVEDALHLLALAACREGQFAVGARTTQVLLAMYAARGEAAYAYRASGLNNLAAMQIELGDLEAAQASLNEGLAIVAAHLGDSHPSYRHLRYQEADLADSRGDHAQSVALLDALAAQIADNVGPESWQARQARARGWLARAQSGQAHAASAAIEAELVPLRQQVERVPALLSILQQVEQMRARALWLAGDREQGLAALRQAHASALDSEGRFGFGTRTLARQLLPMLEDAGLPDEAGALRAALELPPVAAPLAAWIEAIEQTALDSGAAGAAPSRSARSP